MTPADSAALAAAEIARCAAIALATWGITVTPRVTWTLTGTRRLHAYVSKPDAGNLQALGELCRQYGQQVAEGSVECPLIR